MKRVLEKANDSHDKENKANDEARKKLADGLESIGTDTIKDLDEARSDADKREKNLKKEKEEFIDKAKDSKTLASDIADKIGAEFVEND